jgi:hypothetical protein
MLILLENLRFLLENGNSENKKYSDIYVSDQIIEKWKSVMKFTLSN